ncbi:MAG: MFS transporter [Sphaerochaeta sp.]|nr:MFS transporter [Sphaerochaeta sp.]
MYNQNKKAVVLMNFSAFFSGMVFYAPVATIYRQNRGISIWQMSIIEAVSLALMMALELPWGYIADRIGYKHTLVFSFSFLFISKIVFFKANTFPLFLIERILLAIAFSALSGVDIAYLHRFKASHKELALYQGSMFLGLMAVAFIFPLFSEVFSQSAFFTIVSHLLALLFIILLPRETQGENSSSLPKVRLVKTIGSLVQNKALLAYVGGNTVLFGINQMVTLILAQLCYVRVGIPISLFGLSFFLLVVVSFGSSLLSAPLVSRFGAFRTMVFSFVLSLVGVLLLSSLRGVVEVLVGVVLIRLGATLVQPLYFSVTAKVSEGSDLATSLSLNSLLGTSVELFLTLVLGLVAEKNLFLSLQIAGVILVIAMVAIYYGRSVMAES